MINWPLWSEKHPRTPVDIFSQRPSDFRQEFARRCEVELAEGFLVPVVAMITLLQLKCKAGRPQDLADLEALKGNRRMVADENSLKQSPSKNRPSEPPRARGERCLRQAAKPPFAKTYSGWNGRRASV